ncbi:hypothetical protein PTKIN_Ptkin18bG0024100 [Pterospermum kingtungense]
MDSKKSNKIREIVRLQQILKKWKKLANASKNNTNNSSSSSGSSNASFSTHTTNTNSTSSVGGGSRSIKFLKRTLSFTDVASGYAVPKGFLAVCVGKELKRFIIPTEYLGHQAFGILLRKAEEEFGFQQEGALKIPCEVSMFEKILNMVQHKKDALFLHEFGFNVDKEIIGCYSSDSELTSSHHPQMCR